MADKQIYYIPIDGSLIEVEESMMGQTSFPVCSET